MYNILDLAVVLSLFSLIYMNSASWLWSTRQMRRWLLFVTPGCVVQIQVVWCHGPRKMTPPIFLAVVDIRGLLELSCRFCIHAEISGKMGWLIRLIFWLQIWWAVYSWAGGCPLSKNRTNSQIDWKISQLTLQAELDLKSKLGRSGWDSSLPEPKITFFST